MVDEAFDEVLLKVKAAAIDDKLGGKVNILSFLSQVSPFLSWRDFFVPFGVAFVHVLG